MVLIDGHFDVQPPAKREIALDLSLTLMLYMPHRCSGRGCGDRKTRCKKRVRLSINWALDASAIASSWPCLPPEAWRVLVRVSKTSRPPVQRAPSAAQSKRLNATVFLLHGETQETLHVLRAVACSCDSKIDSVVLCSITNVMTADCSLNSKMRNDTVPKQWCAWILYE